MKDLVKSTRKREREQQAHIANCEAQLLRLSSEVTRITMNYNQLRKKRYRKVPGTEGCRQRSDSGTQTLMARELKQELQKVGTQVHTTANELEQVDVNLMALQAAPALSNMEEKWPEFDHTFPQTNGGQFKDLHTLTTTGERFTSKIMQEFADGVDKMFGGPSAHHPLENRPVDHEGVQKGDHVDQEKPSLLPVSSQFTGQLVDDMMDKHIQQLKHDLLKVLDLTIQD